jgi:hypothetical protein
MSLRIVNGYFCRNCADVELAKKGVNPAEPNHEYSPRAVGIPPTAESKTQLGVNAVEQEGPLGTRLNLHA